MDSTFVVTANADGSSARIADVARRNAACELVKPHVITGDSTCKLTLHCFEVNSEWMVLKCFDMFVQNIPQGCQGALDVFLGKVVFYNFQGDMVQTIQHGGVLKYVEWNMPLSCKRLSYRSYNTRLPGNDVAIRSASKVLCHAESTTEGWWRMIVQTGLERRWKGPLATRTLKGALQLRSVGKYIISTIKEYKKGIPSINCVVRVLILMFLFGFAVNATDLCRVISQDVVAKEAGRTELCLHVQWTLDRNLCELCGKKYNK